MSPVRPPPIARTWPLQGRPPVLRAWDPPPTPYAAGHRGVDLGTAPGRPVRAVAPGKIAYAGTVAGRGVLSIDLAGTGTPPLRTTYEPVRPTVHKGTTVHAGQVVALSAPATPHCPPTTACLHWGLRRGDAYLNPLQLLPPELLRHGGSRLLPVYGVPVAGGEGQRGAPAGWGVRAERDVGAGGSAEGSLEQGRDAPELRGARQVRKGRDVRGAPVWGEGRVRDRALDQVRAAPRLRGKTSGGAEHPWGFLVGAVALCAAAVWARLRLNVRGAE
ncbi:M23 family metallopeptidase [Streptomyces sp. ODS28]|uniref:M23 family metallopeptidase n=1 Tax=Streptomyces sp. ODS28 TaxID=3136688 RepID=UPI0031E76191